jgi:hypothetical protein
MTGQFNLLDDNNPRIKPVFDTELDKFALITNSEYNDYMKMKLTNKQIVDDPNVRHGVWVWEMPDGSMVMDEDRNFLLTVGYKGDVTAAFTLAKAVRSFGITEGRPVFLEGHRPIDDEEYARQRFRMSLGLVPDEQDVGVINDELKHGSQ